MGRCCSTKGAAFLGGGIFAPIDWVDRQGHWVIGLIGFVSAPILRALQTHSAVGDLGGCVLVSALRTCCCVRVTDAAAMCRPLHG